MKDEAVMWKGIMTRIIEEILAKEDHDPVLSSLLEEI